MSIKKPKTIKCPVCGREYLPAEIFYPKHFFGNVSNIIKDFNGEIMSYTGDSLNLSETYECDNCNTKFKVTARINFEAEVENKGPVKPEYVSTPEKKFTFFEG